MQLLRERVKQCYRVQGVNHNQNCKEVSQGETQLCVCVFFFFPVEIGSTYTRTETTHKALGGGQLDRDYSHTLPIPLVKPPPRGHHRDTRQQEVKAYLESIKNVGVHRVNIGPHDKPI